VQPFVKLSEQGKLPAINRRLALANGALVAAFVLTLWIPLWWRQQVSTPPVHQADVVGWCAPEPAVADVLWQLALDWDDWEVGRSNILEQANEIIAGRLRLAGRPAVRMQDTDWWSDPYRDSTWRLQFQSLTHARILLAAWHRTGRQIYLSKAEEVILSWIRFSRRWPFGGGYMWNDQVIGDRAVVLSLFWAAYRRSPSYDAAVAGEILRSTAQHVGLLTDSRHFTFLTSHGILQNVALLHVAGTLPILAERAKAVEVAVRRLTLQYRILATPEGVWTEHSAGYQLLAVILLRSASGYLSILGRPIPAEWSLTQARLEKTLIQMARPDGSLPPVGDTVQQSRNAWPPDMVAALRKTKRSGQFLAPCGGYAVLWDDQPAIERQVVLTVSNFRRHSHKHADELSTYIFGEGITWLTGPGYWPYGSRERQYATGWTAANAPSYEGEPEESDRQATLVTYAHGTREEFVEMERSGPGAFHARRRVAWLRPDWLIVADDVSAHNANIVLRWLFSPDVAVDGGNDGGWTARSRTGRSMRRLHFWVLSDKPIQVTVMEGSQRPFRGWAYAGDMIRPAPEFEIKPAGQTSFVASVFHFESETTDRTTTVEPRLERSGDQWSISAGRHFEILLPEGGGAPLDGQFTSQQLRCPSEVRLASRNLEAALMLQYGSPLASVPLKRYRDVTLLIIAAWLFQEIITSLIKRRSEKLVVILRICSCLFLIVAAVYFALHWRNTYVI
jgi:hypothetical protein